MRADDPVVVEPKDSTPFTVKKNQIVRITAGYNASIPGGPEITVDGPAKIAATKTVPVPTLEPIRPGHSPHAPCGT